MCLESSKQTYLLLQVLWNAEKSGNVGLNYRTLLLEMRRLSQEKFDAASYVDIPLPANALIRNAELDGEIAVSNQSFWGITDKGKKLARFLAKREIATLEKEIA